LISVIIPNYNHARFLKKRIESVLAQSYKHFEIIILDDCSSDNSREVIELFRDHPAVSQIIYNERNSGSAFRQWNKGVFAAKGDYVWIAESDDYAAPDFLTVLMTVMQGDPTIGLAYCDSYEIDERNQVMGRWSRWQSGLEGNLWLADFIAPGIKVNQAYNYAFNVIPNASAVLFKKDAYLKSPFLHLIEQLKFTGDWLMWFSILQVSAVFYCHQPLNYFRYHDATTRSDSMNRLQNVREHYQAILKLGRMVRRTNGGPLLKNKFRELYQAWNPALKNMLTQQNLAVLRFALLTDKGITLKLLKTFLKKIHVI